MSRTVFVLSWCLLVRSVPIEYANTRFDGVELSGILNNDELYIKLFQCIIGSGKCSPDWELLKEAVPGALLDDCANCTDKQATGTRELLEHLVRHKLNDMLLLEGEFDPDGSFRKQIENEKEANAIDRKRSAPLSTEVEIFDSVERAIR